MSEITVLVESILSFYETIGPTTAMLLGFLLGFCIFIVIMVLLTIIENFDEYMMKVGFGVMSIITVALLPLGLVLFVVVFAYRSAESQLFRREMKKYFSSMVKNIFGKNEDVPNATVTDYLIGFPLMIKYINQAENPHPVERQVENSENND